jgi:hypothetical protein
MRSWANVGVGIPGVGKSVTFSFDNQEVSFRSSYPMSSTTIRQVLKIISKLEDYLKSADDNDPLDWFKSAFKSSRVEFTLDGRLIMVQHETWIPQVGGYF